MKVLIENCGGVRVLAFRGRLDTSTAEEAQRQFDSLLGAGHDRLLADFAELDFLSSAGLRVLLLVSKRTRSAGGAFGICATNEAVKEVLDISGFSTILRVFPGRREALAAL